MSYKTFYRKVLGEKITIKKFRRRKNIKSKYKRKMKKVNLKEKLLLIKLQILIILLIIVDEAHNLSGNEYGEALKKIKKKI